MRTVSFRVYGEPRPQGSMTAFVPKGWTRAVITHKKAPELMSWREAVRQAALSANATATLPEQPGAILVGPLEAELIFYMPIPKSRPRKLKTDAQRLEWSMPAKRPDLDKLVRAVYDALTKVLWRDDEQVCTLRACKLYDERPGAHVTVREML